MSEWSRRDVLARRRIRVTGVVQGVGFRPHTFRLATARGLTGVVFNDADGVLVEVEGPRDVVAAFESDLAARPPRLATVDSIRGEWIEPAGGSRFEILLSRTSSLRRALVSPDIATCEECLHDLTSAEDRRAGYAFVNCTNCGPRFTIVVDVPYDRAATTMARFAMCGRCRREYEDPSDRRFHAEPIACPACGPSLALDPSGDAALVEGDPVERAVRALAAGAVLAVKGLGGYHLACDASDEQAVRTLRGRKHREEKPFAVMAADLETAATLCVVDAAAAALLGGTRRPVVLLPRRAEAAVAEAVAPSNRFLGVMLPYTPLHHVLLAGFAAARGGAQPALVMTSGNVSDEPIAYADDDAAARLGPIADAILSHDRPIHIRCDDSVMRLHRGAPYPVRRSRGYAPEPLRLPRPVQRPVLAVGAELKHTFCLVHGDAAFVSHHIGDLENWETMRSFLEGVEHYARIFDIRPEVLAHDLHPDYLSTKWCLDGAVAGGSLDLAGCATVGVQHHHAHVASCLADNGRQGPAIGLALDGTGYGPDGTLWGFEILHADERTSSREGHLRTVPLPGGAAAVRQPWRMGAVYLDAAFGADAASLPLDFVRRTSARWTPLLAMGERGVNAPAVSSAGRLFDAVAAVCGIRDEVTYEGQAAMELEQAADTSEDGTYECDLHDDGTGPLVADGASIVRAVAEDLARGTDLPSVAARFHNAVADVLTSMALAVRRKIGTSLVALTGGTFQNVLLLEGVSRRLEDEGFEVLVHRRVPPNDGGISLGQAVVAAAVAPP